MRQLFALLILSFLISDARAIVNPEAGLEEAKLRSPVWIRFRVDHVDYHQNGEILITTARVQIQQVFRSPKPLMVGGEITISYGANYVEESRQIARMEDQAELGIVGPGPALQLFRLRKGQIATGWFRWAEDFETLVPDLGYQSFEDLVLPPIIEMARADTIRLELQVPAVLKEQGVEMRLLGFLSRVCAIGQSCSKDPEPVIEIVTGGKVVRVSPDSKRHELSLPFRLQLLDTDYKSYVTLDLIASNNLRRS